MVFMSPCILLAPLCPQIPQSPQIQRLYFQSPGLIRSGSVQKYTPTLFRKYTAEA